MKESCKYFRLLIERAAELPLTKDEAAELSAHLALCPDCRALQGAYAAIGDVLNDDIQPPADFADSVMSRVRAYGAPPRPRRKNSPQRRALAAAACLVLIAGIGVFSLLRNRMGNFFAVKQNESIAMDMATPAEGRSAATNTAGVEESIAEAAPEAMEPEEAFDVTADMSAAAYAADSGAAYTRENPAYVPEGQEDAFEALLSDARWPEGEPEAAWHVIAAVEHHGVIYEFLTDDGQNYLLWQDAAEGLPVHSPGTVEDLWSVLG